MLTANQIKQFASLKQKKYRIEHSSYLIEGFHLVEECLKSEHELEYIILREGVDLQGYNSILEMISKNKTIVEPLPEKQFKKLIETESSQGIVGVVKKHRQAEYNSPGRLVIALDKVSDPGNLGTIIRTAWWFGAKDILLSEGCADPYNPKVIRATQGGIFHINIIEDSVMAEDLLKLKGSGYKVFLFTLDADKRLSETVNTGRTALVFGSEAHGINEKLLTSSFEKIKIEGKSEAESLNVAISAGIAMYHFAE